MRTSLSFIAAAVVWATALGIVCAQNPLPDISGEWNGLLIGRLHLIVKLEKGADRELKGSLQCPEQGPGRMAIDVVQIDQSTKTLHFELKAIHVVFEGKMTDDLAEIGGQWKHISGG
jgi:hypothetical protein